MSNIEHSENLAPSQTHPSIKAGMEIITGNGIILGRTVSGYYHPQTDSFRILFADSIHPMLNFCSSIYELPAVSIVTIGHDRIVISGDVMPEIVEIRAGMFRFLGLVALNTKLESKKPSYHRSAIEPANSFAEPLGGIDRIDWANDGQEYNIDKIDSGENFWYDNINENNWDIESYDEDRGNDDDLPGAPVLRPKKPNPNLPPSLMLVDDEPRF